MTPIAADAAVAAGATAAALPEADDSPRARAAATIALVALGLGVVGDTLFRVGPPGLNMTLWLGIIAVTAGALLARKGVLTAETRAMLCVAAGFGLLVSGRASLPLDVLAVLAALSALALAAWCAREGSGRTLRRGTSIRYLIAGGRAGMDGAFAPLQLAFADHALRGSALPRVRAAGAVVRGIILTIPLIAIFGSLFMSADAAFSSLVTSLLHWNVQDLASHIVLTGVCAWLASGYLRGAILGEEWDASRVEDLLPSLGIVEIGIVLGGLDALFLAFVLVQLHYFFGGAALVAVTDGLTYADYARRGFFELVAVAALVLPLLIVAHTVLAARTRQALLTFRALAGMLVALVAVVMVSAAHRLDLYQRAYGLTASRVYASVLMVCVAAVLLWFVLTMLRDSRAPFALGTVAIGWLGVLALHVLNPDALVARVNVQRMADGRPFDAAYAVRLSEDADPILLGVLPQLPVSEDRCALARRLARSGRTAPTDWRTWNYGRFAAGVAVRGNSAVTAALASPDCASAKSTGAQGPGPT